MNKEEIFLIITGKETWDNYHKFVELNSKFAKCREYYKYIDDLIDLMCTNDSHIRLRAFILICSLSSYDNKNIINDNLEKVLSILDDKKPTIVRMCLKNVTNIIKNKKELATYIKNSVKSINYNQFKDSMLPLIKKDIDNIINYY